MRINRLSIDSQSLILFLKRFSSDFAWPCFLMKVFKFLFDKLAGKSDGCLLGEPTHRCLVRSNLSNQRPEHTTGGSSGRRTTRQRGGAEPGRTGRRRIGSPRRQLSLVLSKASSTPVLNDSSEARTSEILCKPMGEQNPRLTRGSSVGREALLVPGCSLVVVSRGSLRGFTSYRLRGRRLVPF